MTYNQIVGYYGGLSKAAKALGFDRQRVFSWKKVRIPSEVQIRVAAMTGLKADRKTYEDIARLALFASRSVEA